jgi:hypothetical protein
MTESIKQDTIAKDRRSIQPHRMDLRGSRDQSAWKQTADLLQIGDHVLENNAVSRLSDVTVVWGLRAGMAILRRRLGRRSVFQAPTNQPNKRRQIAESVDVSYGRDRPRRQ